VQEVNFAEYNGAKAQALKALETVGFAATLIENTLFSLAPFAVGSNYTEIVAVVVIVFDCAVAGKYMLQAETVAVDKELKGLLLVIPEDYMVAVGRFDVVPRGSESAGCCFAAPWRSLVYLKGAVDKRALYNF
jgi:hypothetical protein